MRAALFLTSAMSSASASASASSPDRESFHKFFELWLSQQNQLLLDLITFSNLHKTNASPNAPASTSASSEVAIKSLVARVLSHYETYYRTKSIWIKHDALAMLSPTWRSSLEEAFLWIGGWRPSMAFHLLYSKSGLQVEQHLPDLIRGMSTGNLADLTPSQLVRIDELHRKTVREEKETTEKMAKQQEMVADSSMVQLSQAVGEMMRGGDVVADGRVERTLATKEEGLEELLQMADDLRLRTLKGVIEILNPIQAVHFLIAAAELHLRFHEWGNKRDHSGAASRTPDGGVAGSRRS